MGFLCFGSYASLLKTAMGNPADNIVILLLFHAIDKHFTAGTNSAPDFQKYRNAEKKLPTTISSPTSPPDLPSVEKCFSETILPKITDAKKVKTFHESIYAFAIATPYFDDQMLELEKALTEKRFAFFHACVFLYAVTQSNTGKLDFESINPLPLPTVPKLAPSIDDGTFDRVFKLVSDSEKLSHKPDHFIKLFRFDVQSSGIVFDDFDDFIERNIGRYVFSRAVRDNLIKSGHAESIGKKAVELLRKAGGFDKAKISEELGDIILYVLLEHNLKAPKVYNKIEMTQSGVFAVNQGGVHLLTLDDIDKSFQVIVAKSNVVNDLKTAVDNAFTVISTAKANSSAEYKLLDSDILAKSFDDPKITEYLRGIIIPQKRKAENVMKNDAFGVFLGYSINLDPADFTTPADFAVAVANKMVVDIKAQITYIESKIAAAKMGGYSFYFYLIPFNDANSEKVERMTKLVGGDS